MLLALSKETLAFLVDKSALSAFVLCLSSFFFVSPALCSASSLSGRVVRAAEMLIVYIAVYGGQSQWTKQCFSVNVMFLLHSTIPA